MASPRHFGPRDTAVSIVSAVLGTAIWVLLPLVTGRGEAWDAPLYWPTIAIVSLLLGLAAPVRSWRWGLALMAGQLGALLAQSLNDVGNLLPFGVVLLFILGAMCAFLSWLGGRIRVTIAQSQPTTDETTASTPR